MKLLTLNTHSLIEPDYEAKREIFVNSVSYTHLTLPTKRIGEDSGVAE